MTVCIPATFDTAQFDNSFFDITDCIYIQFRDGHDKIFDKKEEKVTLTTFTETKGPVDEVTSSTSVQDTGVRVVIDLNPGNDRIPDPGAAHPVRAPIRSPPP